jgi:hypothetical protein
MRKTERFTGRAKTVALAVAATAAAALTPTVAHGDEAPHRYYIELGGTGSAAAAPDCTLTYYYADQNLDGGTHVPVCYPASAGPWLNGQNAPDLTAPSYDSSVAEGYTNLLAAAEETHLKDPAARLTIVGYSQGAQAADAVLETIAANATDIPREPKQPDTGLWAKVPKGLGAFGFTSAGPGPKEFPGVPVARFCIRGDLVCDATTPVATFDLFLTDKHRRYFQDGNIMTRTITNEGLDGVFWYES